MITRTAALLPQCICSPCVLWTAGLPLWRRNQRRQSERDLIRSWLSLFISVRVGSIGRRCSGVRTRKCDHILSLSFFPPPPSPPSPAMPARLLCRFNNEPSDKWIYRPFDIQLPSRGKIFFRRWRRRRGLCIQDGGLCFLPFGDGSFILSAPDWPEIKTTVAP